MPDFIGAIMKKILWYIKQLLPLKYKSIYKENGKTYLSLWNMWYGKCFNIEKYQIAEKA